MGGDASGIDAGLIGLLLLIGLFVVSGFLGASMMRHMRKVPPSFSERDRHGRPVNPPGDEPPAR